MKGNENLGRYESASGWEPEDTYKGLRDEYRRSQPDDADDPFVVHSGNEIFANGGGNLSQRLFGEFWSENELAILFGDTGLGKSILAVQIGTYLANGLPCTEAGEAAGAEANYEPDVLYLDFELTNGQFGERYRVDGRGPGGRSEEPEHADLSPRFHRATFEWNGIVPECHKTLGHFMYWAVAKLIHEYSAKVLIVDNVSYLSTANFSAGSMHILMKALKTLKDDLNISILVLAHTPKRRFGIPLSLNDLAGSKIQSNVADSVFAIGRDANDVDVRYITQVKSRFLRVSHDSLNVITCRIGRTGNAIRPESGNTSVPQALVARNSPMLAFHFEGVANERTHLANSKSAHAVRAQLIGQAKELADRGTSQRQIAAQLGIGLTTVRRYLSAPPTAFRGT